ncbi:MAG: hypothetical protein V7647_2787 [Acidobacteriota bacterium]|jgi:hypothetical protein
MLVPRALAAAAALVLFSTVPLHAATVPVAAGADLQAALNAANPGDVLMLAEGATFTGNFILPDKPGTSVITVRSGAADATVPGTGVRITPAFAARLAKLQSPNTMPAIVTAPGAHHWRLQLLELPPTQLGYGEILRIGEGAAPQTLLSQVPYEIELDRLYVHGDPLYGQKRGIALNGTRVIVRNCYISDIKAVGFDTQAIGGWNGPGPFTIENNYLEAAGENLLLGGSDPSIAGLVSENVVFRYNYVTKPMAWRNAIIPAPQGASASALAGAGTLPAGTYAYAVLARRQVGGGTWGTSAASMQVTATVGDQGAVSITWAAVADATEYRVYGRSQYWTVTRPSLTDTGAPGTAAAMPTAGGTTWQVKNLLELKNARHVTIEYNVFENNWVNAQKGYAILFTPRNQNGACTWCVVEDVTFQFNEVRNVAGGVSILGYDSPNISAQTTTVVIRHNLFHGITKTLGGSGWFLLIGDEPRDVTIDHNTIDFDGTTAVYAYGGTDTAPRQITGFRFVNNALRHNLYGINGAGSSYGNTALTAYFPGSVVQGNWLQGGTASRYPAGNIFAGTFEPAFMDVAAGDYRVSVGSVLLGGALDGTNIGADTFTLLAGLRLASAGIAATAPARPGGLRVIR